MEILVPWWSKVTCFCGSAEPLGGGIEENDDPTGYSILLSTSKQDMCDPT